MPTSKKPRKKHIFRARINPYFVKRENVEEIRSQFDKLLLVVEIKLPRGLMDDIDFYLLRDFVNWGIIAASTRTWYTDETRTEVSAKLHEAALKLSEM